MATTGHESEVIDVQGLASAMAKAMNLGIPNKGICATAAATQEKTVKTGDGFKLTADAMVIVTFENAVSTSGATLNVNSTGSKPIYYNGAALASGLVQAGSKVILRYNASKVTGQDTETGDDITGAWEVVGSLGAIYEDFGGSGSNHKAGLVPDPGATVGTGKYLREDGSWQTPPDNDHNTKYKLKIGSTWNGDNDGTNLGELESKDASDGGTDLSLVTTGEKYTWNKKQNALNFDNSPVKNSSNPVKSGGLFTALAGKQDTITDRSFIGDGSGVCSTDAATQEKAVTITNFVLLKYGFVSVRFQKGVKVSGATLKINDNAAKAILIEGMALPAGVIRENVTALMQYDGTYFNIVSINTASVSGDGLLVDLGLPSGLKWATRNIDVNQANGFAASPYQYECSFFSWGNTDGHNPVSNNSFGEWSFGNANTSEPYVSSPGAALTADAGLGYDASRANLGGPWRLPTTTEFAELFSNIDYLDADGAVIDAATADKRCNYNGVMGLRLRSKINSKEIFFACSGYGLGQSWNNRGSYGYYWSSSLYSAARGRNLDFGSGGVYPQDYYNRFNGFAVRPVQ